MSTLGKFYCLLFIYAIHYVKTYLFRLKCSFRCQNIQKFAIFVFLVQRFKFSEEVKNGKNMTQ